MKTKKNEKLQSFAKKLMESTGPLLNDYVTELLGNLWGVIFFNGKGPTSSDLRGKMWNRFHNFRCDKKVVKAWQDLLLSINVSSLYTMKLQLHMLQHVLEFVIKALFEEFDKHDVPKSTVTYDDLLVVDKHEEQVLRYVAGYIPFALRRRYSK